MNAHWIKPLFVVAAVYEGLLGITFLLFSGALFAAFGVEPPNHLAYVQFPALLLIVFGALFLRIARDPVANRDLIPYGMALKVAYCGLTFWHQAHGGVPFMWLPWAWADGVFLVLFGLAWRALGMPPQTRRADAPEAGR